MGGTMAGGTITPPPRAPGGGGGRGDTNPLIVGIDIPDPAPLAAVAAGPDAPLPGALAEADGTPTPLDSVDGPSVGEPPVCEPPVCEPPVGEPPVGKPPARDPPSGESI